MNYKLSFVKSIKKYKKYKEYLHIYIHTKTRKKKNHFEIEF